jgi:polar amino acid transport system substrate-binding protein
VFLAIDPERAVDIAFSRPYVVIEGTYLVRKDSPFKRIQDLDREGVKIIVGLRAPTTLPHPRDQESDTRARRRRPRLPRRLAQGRVRRGGRRPRGARRRGETRSVPHGLDGHFMTIPQAVGVPKARQAAARYVDQFVAEMIESGFVRRSLEKSGK